jgi:8-amino-7-oxononanoate synthase
LFPVEQSVDNPPADGNVTAPMADPLDSIREELHALDAAGLRRRIRPIDGMQAEEVVVDGRRAINFSSNNYLGLASHPLLREAAEAAMREHGFGSGASRLIAGSLAPHRALEARIAAWKKTEAALLFNSGYHANVGLVSALAGPDDAIFSDELNHASLIDGCRLSRARVVVFRHADPDDLARKLAETPGRRRIILTDSIFSMDGDRAPLAALAELKQRHGALLVVDDAHAIGVLGKDGVGLCDGLDVDLQMGTLGKALGGFGAYVAARRPVVELLANRARSFVFTTALPVPVVAAAIAAIDWLTSDEGRQRRERLASIAARIHERLRPLGLSLPPSPSHILPLRAREGDPRRAMEACEALLARGIFAQGIRPPTVPPSTARIRFALMATHTDAQLDRACDALAAARDHLT